MRRHSNSFPMPLIGAVWALTYVISSIYEDAIKAHVLKVLGDWFGPMVAEMLSNLTEISTAVGVGAITVLLLYRYMDREFRRRSLEFVRHLPPIEGNFGYYRAYISVHNTSPTEKMSNCRCEIVTLLDSEGRLVERNIGLRTKGQETKKTQGRFNIDQDSTKDLPIFDIDQSADDGLTVINANDWDMRLDHGIYIARIRGYGDEGDPDDITVRIDSRNCQFELISSEAASPQAMEENFQRRPWTVRHRDEDGSAGVSIDGARRIRRFIASHNRFTLWESACLLAEQEIDRDVVGVAAGILHDIRSRLVREKIKSLQDIRLQIAMAKLPGGQREPINADVEISKDTLRKLAQEFGVSIPGLFDEIKGGVPSSSAPPSVP